MSGDDDHRDGIKPGSGDSGDGVGSAGAAGDADRGGDSGDAGVCLRRDCARLFMQTAEAADTRFRAERIVQVHCSAAGNEERLTEPPVRQSPEDVIAQPHPMLFSDDFYEDALDAASVESVRIRGR